MYNGFDWYGRVLEVREVWLCFHRGLYLDSNIFIQDRYAGLSGPGGYRGGFRGGLRGLRGAGRGGAGFGGRGGYGRGGGGGYAAGGRNFSDQDLYKDYVGPEQQAGGYTAAGYNGGEYPGAGGYTGGGYGVGGGYESEPSQQIMVRNVSGSRKVAIERETKRWHVTRCSCRGRRRMKTLSSCSRRLDRSSWLRYCSMARDQRVPASCSLRRLPRQRQPLVRSTLYLLLYRPH